MSGQQQDGKQCQKALFAVHSAGLAINTAMTAFALYQLAEIISSLGDNGAPSDPENTLPGSYGLPGITLFFLAHLCSAIVSGLEKQRCPTVAYSLSTGMAGVGVVASALPEDTPTSIENTLRGICIGSTVAAGAVKIALMIHLCKNKPEKSDSFLEKAAHSAELFMGALFVVAGVINILDDAANMASTFLPPFMLCLLAVVENVANQAWNMGDGSAILGNVAFIRVFLAENCGCFKRKRNSRLPSSVAPENAGFTLTGNSSINGSQYGSMMEEDEQQGPALSLSTRTGTKN